jgi:hypothetical protein
MISYREAEWVGPWEGLSAGKPDSDYDKNQINKGINVEMEHVKDKPTAKNIAKDHLQEFKGQKYYDELEKMEEKLKEQTKKEQ